MAFSASNIKNYVKEEVTWTTLPRDLLAGAISALVAIAYCISFSALIFQGYIADGFALGMAALIAGTVIANLIVSLTTSLSPAAAGPDTPAVAVLSVLASSIAASFAAKNLGSDLAVMHVLLAISLSTLLTGLMLFGMGTAKIGTLLRFVPYPVIGGFLAASGWLLLTGGIEVMSGASVSMSTQFLNEILSPHNLPQIATGMGFAITVFLVRRKFNSYVILPAAFFAALLTINGLLSTFGSEERNADWFLQTAGVIPLWLPLNVIISETIDWQVFVTNMVEILAVCGVTAISMLLDVSSIEVSRSRTANLDHEFRSNGVANIVSSLFGGVASNLSLNGSVLVQQAGAVTRLAGVVASTICALVLVLGGDIASYIPKPLLGGLLAYLGIYILSETLLRTPTMRSWGDFALAAGILVIIVNWGYLLGVMMGIIGACLTFAFSYSRIGVVRRHVTRADFSSNVERSTEQKQCLRENGKRIHLIWLSGYIFFGSSNGLFEYIRTRINEQTGPGIRHIVLDFSGVTGLDSSAMLSLIKLRNYCDGKGVILCICGANEKTTAAFRNAGFFNGTSKHKLYGSRNVALEACENTLLEDHAILEKSEEAFEDWLERELSNTVNVPKLLAYLKRHEVAAGEEFYKQGGPADTVEFVASGLIAIVADDAHGNKIQLRRMAGQTVVGEMGFYRHSTRTASVIAEEPTILYQLTREAYHRMQAEDPELSTAFDKFIIRLLADRLQFASLEISALI